MHIVNHRLVGPNVTFRAAQSAGGRLKQPTAICCHDTAGSLKKFSSVKWFESPDCGTSAHVVIELDGTVTQMVAFDTIAYHAGRSTWKERADCNKYMIGIEIVSPGMMVRRGEEAQLIYKTTDKNGKVVEKIVERFPISKCEEVNTKEHGKGLCLPYTDAQIHVLSEVCRAIADAYDSVEEIVTHWLISPGRKVDTTPIFPLEQVRLAAFGTAKLATLPVAPPAPEAVAPPASVPPPVGYVKAASESKTVGALILAFFAWLADLFKDTLNAAFDWAMWTVGILPNVVTEVKTTLTNGELMASWFKVSWPKITLYVTVACIGIAVIRHVRDKRQLAQAKAQLETAQKG